MRRAPHLATLLLAPALLAAGWDGASLRTKIEANRAAILEEFRAFLALPNVSSGPDAAADLEANALWIEAAMGRRGLEVRRLDGAPLPYLLARLPAPPGTPATTVLFYVHYDGQSVRPAGWTVTPPFSPFLRGEIGDPDARLFARSVADDKVGVLGLLAALDVLRASGQSPNVEVKIILDPEEEIGSPHLEEVVARHTAALRADLLIFCDGPVHQSNRPTVVFGTRGLVTVRLTVYGARGELHSGHYGNWAPNPAEKLSALLASMKDADGRVLVEGFYDEVRPLSESEAKAIASVPPVEEELRASLQIARPDGAGKTLQELINLPSLNIRGLHSADVGPASRTVVPAQATAELDLRLVPDVDPGRQVQRLRRHVERQGFFVVEDEPDAETRRAHPRIVRLTSGPATPASRTSMDHPAARALIAATARAAKAGSTRSDLVLMPTLGGTGPLSRLAAALELPVFGVPVVNFDNNQHADDENLRLGHLWDGILIYTSLLRLDDAAGARP